MIKYSASYIENLIANGGLKKIGVDNDGDDILMITKKCKELDPSLFKFRMDYIGLATIHLWEEDLVEVFMDEGTFKMVLTDKAFDDKIISNLPEDLKYSLDQVKHTIEDQ